MNTDPLIERKLCNSADLPDDSMKEIEIDVSQEAGESKTTKVLLIKQKNRFYCLAPRCTHYSVPLVNGVVHKNRLRCFAHGACFDIRTGDIEDYPGVDCLPKYDLFVDKNSDIYLKATLSQLLSSKRLGDRVNKRPSSAASQSEHRPCSSSLKSINNV